MNTVTLTPADDIDGCPFPFFEQAKPVRGGFCKIYNDGGHYIATPVFRKNAGGQEVKQKERLTRDYSREEENYCYERALRVIKKRNSDKTRKISPAEELDLTKKLSASARSGMDVCFDGLYFQALKQGLKDTKLEKQMTDYIKAGLLKLYDDTPKLDEYIAKRIKSKANNLLHRKKRFRRKAYLNRWNYFVTFTYDDKKQTAESFKKKLRKCLSNFATRRGWRYMGVFELSPEEERLHFHGLFYIPAGQMVGEITEKQDYSTVSHSMQTRCENSFFEEAFGRNDFCEVSMDELRNGKRTEYILKYIGKTNERICYSRGIPTEVYREIENRDVVTEMHDFVVKFILFDDVVDWERDVMRLRKIKQMSITDILCNPPLTA